MRSIVWHGVWRGRGGSLPVRIASAYLSRIRSSGGDKTYGVVHYTGRQRRLYASISCACGKAAG